MYPWSSHVAKDVLINLAMVKVTGAFQKSTEIMKMTNQLIKLPQLSATMREMSMEMMKVGTSTSSIHLPLLKTSSKLMNSVGNYGGDDGRDA